MTTDLRQRLLGLTLVAALASLTGPARASVENGQKPGSTGGTPGFSGTWVVKDDGGGAAAGGGGGGRGAAGPVTIDQTPQQITIQSGQQARVIKLDGSESVNELTGRGGTQRTRSKARWEGNKLVIETVNEGTGRSSKEVRSLSADGKEMTVETTAEGPQGLLTRTTVYRKGS